MARTLRHINSWGCVQSTHHTDEGHTWQPWCVSILYCKYISGLKRKKKSWCFLQCHVIKKQMPIVRFLTEEKESEGDVSGPFIVHFETGMKETKTEIQRGESSSVRQILLKFWSRIMTLIKNIVLFVTQVWWISQGWKSQKMCCGINHVAALVFDQSRSSLPVLTHLRCSGKELTKHSQQWISRWEGWIINWHLGKL